MIQEKILITAQHTLSQALKLLDDLSTRVLFIVNPTRQLLGSLSDGDIRRALLKGAHLNDSVESFYFKETKFFYEGHIDLNEAKDFFQKMQILFIPLLNKNREILEILSLEELLEGRDYHEYQYEAIHLPVLIMAGGKGTRLAPFTNILPKPLIPVGERTILEEIIRQFEQFGVQEFIFTVNFKGEIIKAYFDGLDKNYSIEYIWEKDFLGTAGCLKLWSNPPQTFIVSNCDILVRTNYAELLKFHKESKSKLTVVSSIQHHKVPYGVVNFEKGGLISSLSEKPEFSFPINTGVYLLEKECLDLIPEGEVFHMTDLIDKLIQMGEKVYTYPVSGSDYVDIGEWSEYHKTVNLFQGKL